MPDPPIHIIVERGRVTLTGVVLKTDAEVGNEREKSD
jgi:hypothetical protein